MNEYSKAVKQEFAKKMGLVGIAAVLAMGGATTIVVNDSMETPPLIQSVTIEDVSK